MTSELRNKKLKFNIVAGFGIRGLSILLGLVFIPLVLNYLTSYKYGIWLTINSVIAWFSYFDIGLSGCLRIRLQELLAIKDYVISKEYVSTTYILLSLISLVATILVISILYLFDFDYVSFFKATSSLQNDLSQVMYITVICFFIRFIFQPISTILSADQNNSIASLIMLTENILNIIGIYFLSVFTNNSLLLACIVFSVSPIINLIIYSVLLFKTKYKEIRPSIKSFNTELIKPLIGVSLDIFIISISLILLIQTNNILITKLFAPQQVTEYNLSYKLFSTFGTAFTLIVTPMWSAFAEAYALHDFDWIKKALIKILKIYLVLATGMILLIPFTSKILFLWTHLKIENYSLFIWTSIYFIVQSFMMIFSFLFNGMGIIKLQRNIAIYGALVNIPLIILMVNVLHWGLSSILIANTIAILPAVFIYPYIANKKLKMI